MLNAIELNVSTPELNSDLEKVLSGLRQPFKSFPTEFTFDKNGSQIYDLICKLPEYYPAHKEIAIMEQYIDEFVSLAGTNSLLIEYGSGSSYKTRILLDNFSKLAGYVPIDISEKYLLDSASKIAENYPHLEVLPVCTNYHDYFKIPSPKKPVKNRLVFFSGIAAGNEHKAQLINLLKKIKYVCGANGGMLISIDLKKDLQILNSAYNDSAGLGANLALNYLRRMNKEFSADFQTDQFEYKAVYNEKIGRMEMKLISLQKQTVHIGNYYFKFEAGETISFAYSYKYTLDEFAKLAAQAGWEVKQVWTDSQKLLSIQYLTIA